MGKVWRAHHASLKRDDAFKVLPAEMRRAVEQDPLNATWHGILGAHLMDAGQLEEGLKAVVRANEIEPNYYVSVHLKGEMLWVLAGTTSHSRHFNARTHSRHGSRFPEGGSRSLFAARDATLRPTTCWP